MDSLFDSEISPDLFVLGDGPGGDDDLFAQNPDFFNSLDWPPNSMVDSQNVDMVAIKLEDEAFCTGCSPSSAGMTSECSPLALPQMSSSMDQLQTFSSVQPRIERTPSSTSDLDFKFPPLTLAPLNMLDPQIVFPLSREYRALTPDSLSAYSSCDDDLPSLRSMPASLSLPCEDVFITPRTLSVDGALFDFSESNLLRGLSHVQRPRRSKSEGGIDLDRARGDSDSSFSLIVPNEDWHDPHRPFECGLCQTKFRRKYDLIRHNILHTNEKPFVCEICGKGFSRRDALQRHHRVEQKRQPTIPPLTKEASNRGTASAAFAAKRR